MTPAMTHTYTCMNETCSEQGIPKDGPDFGETECLCGACGEVTTKAAK